MSCYILEIDIAALEFSKKTLVLFCFSAELKRHGTAKSERSSNALSWTTVLNS